MTIEWNAKPQFIKNIKSVTFLVQSHVFRLLFTVERSTGSVCIQKKSNRARQELSNDM